MASPINRRITRLAISLSLLSLTAALWAADPPDLELNPTTGNVESVDSDPGAGDRVRHVDDQGQGGNRTITHVSVAAGGKPRLAIRSDGDSWVVWESTDAVHQIRAVSRDGATGGWSPERLVSDAAEDSRSPQVVHDGSSTFIAWSVTAGTDTSVAVVGIVDDPEPFPTRSILDTTDFTGNVDVQVHSGQGNVWVTWVDGSSAVGWSEWDAASEIWSTPQFESYVGTSVAVARQNIRVAVFAP